MTDIFYRNWDFQDAIDALNAELIRRDGTINFTGSQIFEAAVQVDGALTTDTINEYTATSGVTIDGALVKDSDYIVPVAAKTTTYQALATDHLVTGDASFGDFTITLPAIASVETGKQMSFKNVGVTGTVTIDGSGAETIDGAATQALGSQYKYLNVINSGAAWLILGSN